MSHLVLLPTLSANDDSALVIEWLKPAGERVAGRDPICAVETSKSVEEIEAQADGYLRPLVEPGRRVAFGAALAAVTDQPDEDISALLAQPNPTNKPGDDRRRWTKKAEILAGRYGVSLQQVAEAFPETLIGEAEVEAFRARKTGGTAVYTDEGRTPVVQRVVVLGASGGATLILDALCKIPHQRAVGVLDRDPRYRGQSILGVPVLGSTDETEALYEAGRFDAAVIAFNTDLDERAEVFERLKGQGVPFANVVDTTVQRRSDTQIGTGNVILTRSYIGPGAKIGDNNFLSSHTCIEHHCRLGSHCAFGPSVSFSGLVTVGDRVRFGMNIGVEPSVRIGDGAVIASGAILTRPVPAGATVKSHSRYSIHDSTR